MPLLLVFILISSSDIISIVYAVEYSFVTVWGDKKQFRYADGIAVDSLNNIYVADTYNHRIQKFDSNGTFITMWGERGNASGQFLFPQDVAIGPSDNIYVTDQDNHRIQKFDSNGTFITMWGSKCLPLDELECPNPGDGEFSVPDGIAVDSNDNVYVFDGWNARIQKFDSNGTFITKWGSEGSGDGQFDGLFADVAVDSSGNVHVADSFNARIQKFDSNGTFITKWGSRGSGDGQFDNARSLTVDTQGNIHVVDDQLSLESNIQKFTSDGKFITKRVLQAPDPGSIYIQPHRVAVDSNGNVYVVVHDRIQVYSQATTSSS